MLLEYSDAVLLGIIQGLTEFLPVSSTAHLRLYSSFRGAQDIGTAYSAVIQLGTWFALLLYFRHDIIQILKETGADLSGRLSAHAQDGVSSRTLLKTLLSQENWQPGSLLFFYVSFATLPICILALLCEHWIRGPLRSPEVIAGALISIALLLLLSEYFHNTQKKKGKNT